MKTNKKVTKQQVKIEIFEFQEFFQHEIFMMSIPESGITPEVIPRGAMILQSGASVHVIGAGLIGM